MLSSATDVGHPVGLGISNACAGLAEHVTLALTSAGKPCRAFDLAAGKSGELENAALDGRLAAVIELGLEDYIIEVVAGRAVSSNRLTGAIQSHLPQVWVLAPLAEALPSLNPDQLDVAGKHLAWLASAANPHPSVIVVPGDSWTDVLAESFRLWALASVPVHHCGGESSQNLAALIVRCLG